MLAQRLHFLIFFNIIGVGYLLLDATIRLTNEKRVWK